MCSITMDVASKESFALFTAILKVNIIMYGRVL